MALRKSGLYEKIKGKELNRASTFKKESGNRKDGKTMVQYVPETEMCYFLVCSNPRMKLNQVSANLNGCSLESPMGPGEREKEGWRGERGGRKEWKQHHPRSRDGCLPGC